MLVASGGLPGTGKTTVARAVAARHRAAYIRIDAIEQAMRAAGVLAAGVGPAGYMAAYCLAEANLRLGLTVVADSVNPLAATRAAWRAVAAAPRVPIVQVELVCSDAAEHRRRVETRVVDIPGLVPPTWEAVQARDYDVWSEPRVLIDTAALDAEGAVGRVLAAMVSAAAGASG